MSNPRPCHEQAALSQQDLDLLDALPDGAHEIDFTALYCELQVGHPGPHLALGQAYGSRERWLQWLAAQRRDWLDIEDSEHCDAEGPPVFEDIPDDPELCLLPAAHSGGHSFEIARAQA
jgi:hypothetical protein